MTASLSPTPVNSGAPLDTTGAPGSTNGAGLVVVEPRYRTFADSPARRCGISQLAGELYLWGLGVEAALYIGVQADLTVWLLANGGVLAAWIAGREARDEHAKRRRIAARQRG